MDRKKDAQTVRNKNYLSYKFELVYRGINSELFRKSCNNLRVPGLFLIKCQNSKIFGGYTPIGFYTNSFSTWIHSKDSFIFSLENDNIQSMKLSRVISYDYAIYNNRGFNFGGNALYMKEQYLYTNNHNRYYENNIKSDVNKIEEIEAFVVSSRR